MENKMMLDKNGCGYMDLVCYQCSGGNYAGMENKPKGCMEYIKEESTYQGSKRSHVYTCKDCNYNATYSNEYLGKYEIKI